MRFLQANKPIIISISVIIETAAAKRPVSTAAYGRLPSAVITLLIYAANVPAGYKSKTESGPDINESNIPAAANDSASVTAGETKRLAAAETQEIYPKVLITVGIVKISALNEITEEDKNDLSITDFTFFLIYSVTGSAAAVIPKVESTDS